MVFPDFVERMAGNGVNRPELVRRILRLRPTEPMDERKIASLGRTALLARPEVMLVDLVESWCEMEAQGRSEADILLAIVTHRRDVLGDEPLPAQLDLYTYARYRMRLEHRDDPVLSEAEFVTDAVNAALEKFRPKRAGGARGISSSDRDSRPAGMSVVVLYAIVMGVIFVLPLLAWVVSGKPPRSPFFTAFSLNAAIMLLSAIAFFALRNWGRWLLSVTLAVLIALGFAAAYPFEKHDLPPLVFHSVNSVLAFFCIRSLHGRKMRQVFG